MMRGETAAVNVDESEHGENATHAEAVSSERRPSIAVLQNMLKKASQSPVQNHYNNEVQELRPTPQNGATDSLAATNPFYAYHMESSSKGHKPENIRMKTSEEADLDALFAPPPEFRSSPLDLHPKMNAVENVSFLSESPNISQTSKHEEDLFPACTLDQSVNVALKSPDLFSTSPAQSQNWLVKSSDPLKDEGLFHTAEEKDLSHSELNLSDKSSIVFVDPFQSPSNKENLFQSPQTVAANPFYSSTATRGDLSQSDPAKFEELFHIRGSKQDEKDLFGKSPKENFDIFVSSSTNTVDSFPSPFSSNLFQDVSSLDDPFSPTPSKQLSPLKDMSNGTPDIFQPFLSEDKARWTTAPSKTASSTPLMNSPSELKLDTPELQKKSPSKAPPAVPPKPLHRPQEIVLTTPQGSKHDILQPTPFSQAVGLSTSSSQSPSDMTHVPTFRRPPKPLPRSRPPRREKSPKQEKSPEPVISVEPEPDVQKTSPKMPLRPKPVIRRKPKTKETKPVDSENFVVFEDVLLIGQEKCVEDWPEDSPQLNPEFKPSGKLKLRRESLKSKMDSDGGSGEDQDGSGTPSKRKDKKFKLVSRRGSKEKFTDDTVERRGRSSTLPSHKSSKDYLDSQGSQGENEDEEQNGMDYKKKPLKTKVNQLFRRASTASSVFEGKTMNGHSPHESKGRDNNKKSGDNSTIDRRWSEGKVLDGSTGEDEEGGEPHHHEKRKKMKIKFVPHRGFTISLEKTNAEPKGAHGYTPRKGSKDKSPDVSDSHSYSPREKHQDIASEDVKEVKGQRCQSSSKAASVDDEPVQRSHHYAPRPDEDEDAYGIQDCKPKKPTKIKLPHVARRRSKENMLHDSMQKKKSSLSAEELDDEELKMEDSKWTPVPAQRRHRTADGVDASSGFSHRLPPHASKEEFAQDEMTEKDFPESEEAYAEDLDEHDIYKPKKPLKLKVFKKRKPKNKVAYPENEDPPGAASMSEAAKAEWMAAQIDERTIAGLEDDDEEEDTDSLMEWWYTVEKWDEVPSDEEDAVMKEDESKSFTILADKVHRGLRVFNKVFMERAEVLWQSIIMIHTIADDISEFHQKAKIAGITGGTTTAVGGVTAIAGLALAPFTFGASLVITAVGVGVATAGGITSASAAISDNVNNTQDRKKVEIVLREYEDHLLDIGKILHFINQGLYKLRGHPFLRSGTQHYSEDWEIRRAVQMISLVDSPVMRATDTTDAGVASLQGLFKGMDKYFIKETRELKKGCKKEIVAQIREVANVLNDTVVELNAIREELQDAIGNV